MSRKPLPRSLRYRRRPLVVPPPVTACGYCQDEGRDTCRPDCRYYRHTWPTPDTKKPGEPME